MKIAKERPLIFTTQMVKAILDGRKTMTRRILDYTHPAVTGFVPNGEHGYWMGTARSVQIINQYITTFPFDIKCPFGKVGDRLWVREAFVPDPSADSDHWNDEDSQHTFYSWDGCGSKISELPKALKTNEHVCYKASVNHPELSLWHPNYRMPRWASRILLEITNIRVERLNQISKEDAIAEGCSSYGPFGEYMGAPHPTINDHYQAYSNPVNAFKSIWEHENGNTEWDKNPWVWVIEFKAIEGGISS